jgi:hypothetical protein
MDTGVKGRITALILSVFSGFGEWVSPHVADLVSGA